MNSIENITFRRRRTYSDSSNVSELTFTENTLDVTTSSLPDVSDQYVNQQIIQLKEEIENLKINLNSAHDEIESLSLENNELKRTNTELMKINELYKRISSSPAKPNSSIKKKKQNVKHNANKTTQTEIINDNKCKQVRNIPDDENNKSGVINDNVKESAQNEVRKSQICVLSTDKKTNVLTIADKYLTCDRFKVCQYLKPHVGTVNLLDGIKNKLKEYTLKDYCIILIGEEDFKTTQNYFNIIFTLRKTLCEITNTNLIICLPTYKCRPNSNVYNWRVENFNNLLYLDIVTNNYAYLIDSNLNLTYDYRMFNSHTGEINYIGKKTIFRDVEELINSIEKITKEEKPSYNELNAKLNEKQNIFFL